MSCPTRSMCSSSAPARPDRPPRPGRPGRARRHLVDAAVVPARQALRRRTHPAGDRRAAPAGPGGWLAGRATNWGLRAAGFGQELYLPWPGGSLPGYGGAAPRLELDAAHPPRGAGCGRDRRGGPPGRRRARRRRSGVVTASSSSRPGRRHGSAGDRLPAAGRRRRRPIAAGPRAGPQWHRDTAYGVAARAYIDVAPRDDPWISSHLELRGDRGRAAVRLWLGVPARRRRGQRGGRHAGHRQAPRRRQPARPARGTTPTCAGGLGVRRRAAGAVVGAAADGRSGDAAWPGPTGC